MNLPNYKMKLRLFVESATASIQMFQNRIGKTFKKSTTNLITLYFLKMYLVGNWQSPVHHVFCCRRSFFMFRLLWLHKTGRLENSAFPVNL